MSLFEQKNRYNIFISAVIPAYNEIHRIGRVVKECLKYCNEVIVIDDGSVDNTATEASKYGAKVIRNLLNKGYIYSIKKGFKVVSGDIIVTIDADGEHSPSDIPALIKPILDGRADMVLGSRDKIDRISERLISLIVKLKTGIRDTGTGFRAIKRDLALDLKYKGKCICGISVLEPWIKGANILEVRIKLNRVTKRRKIAWNHIIQIFYVLIFLFKKGLKKWILKNFTQIKIFLLLVLQEQ